MSILSWWFHILAVTAVIVSMLSRVAVAQCDTCAPRDDCCSGIGGSCYNNVTSKCCQQSWAAAVCDENQTCCGYGYQNSAVSFCCPSETPICCNGACCSVDKPLCCGSFCCASNQVCGETSCEASIPITPVTFSLILPVDLSIFNSYTAQLTCGLRFLSVVLNNDNRESMEWNALVVDTTTTAVVCQVFNGSNVYVVPHTEFLVATSYVAITGYTLNSSPCEPLWQVPTTACESANSLTQAGPFVFALCYPSVLVISVETGAVMLSLTKVSNSVMAENAFVVLFVNGTLAAFDLSALKTTWSHSVFVSAADTSCGLVVNASVVAACVISSDVYFSHTVNITSGVVQRVINFGMNSTAGWSLHWASPPTAYFWYANPVWPNGDTATYQLLNMVDGSSLTPITNVQSTERCCSVFCPPLFGGTLCGGVVAEFESATTVGGQCQPGAYDAVSPHSNATFVTLPSGWTGSSVQLPNSGCAFATVESIYGRFSNITFGTINDPSESLLAPIITDKTPHQVQVFAGFVMAVTSDGATINVTGWWQNAQH